MSYNKPAAMMAPSTREPTMDLDEYLFYEKKKNKEFSDMKFAETLGFTKGYFSRVQSGVQLPSAHFLYLIDKHSEGKVDVLKMLKEAYSKKDKG